MKIGTVTYWNTQDNYGQILQCYALLTTLRDMGHDAFLIKYLPAPRQQSLVHLLITAVRYLSPSYRRTALMWRRLRRIAATEALLHPRGFDQFRTEYIPSTSRTYNENELEETPPEADAYICGSDQIWGVPNPVYFLQFGKATTKRLAYAPSMGGITPKGKDKKTISTYLSRFDFISSREGKDVQTLHEMGFSQAIQQPDPTLLLSAGTVDCEGLIRACQEHSGITVIMVSHQFTNLSSLVDYQLALANHQLTYQGRKQS